MTQNVVSVEGLFKRFGNKTVIEECSFAIAQGTVFGLVGKNGVGKTTLIRLLLGLLKPDAGELSVLGFQPWQHAARLYRSLGVVLEHDGFSGNCTVAENLALFTAAKGLQWSDVFAYVKEHWADTFIGEQLAGKGKKVKFLSRGQRVQCGLCRAFLGWPSLFFFDEPTVALDVEAYEHFCAMTRKARDRGASMLISSHQLSTIQELCDEVGILDNKRVRPVHGGAADSAMPQWSLSADYSDEYNAIIEQCLGLPAPYEAGAWQLIVKTPKTMIPRLIGRLAAAGCLIYEVKREKRELKDIIKAHYESNRLGPA